MVFSALLALSLCVTPAGYGRDLRLAWDPNSEPDLAGYKVYYGLSSGRYSSAVDVGNRTVYSLTGLDDARTYYLATSAYNTGGQESAYSNEVVAAAIAQPPAPPTAPPPGDTTPGTPPPADTTPGTTPQDPGTTPPGSSTETPTQPASPTSDSGGGGGGCFIATAAYGSYLAPEVRVLRDFRDRWLLTNGPGQLFVKLYYRHSPPVADFISRHEWLRTLTRWALSPIVYSLKCSLSITMVLIGLSIAVYLRRRVRRDPGIILAGVFPGALPRPCDRTTR